MQTNSNEFVSQQYKDSSKLKTRINIHELYSTNPQDWHKWVFSKISLPSDANVVEFGCGSGALWQKNLSEVVDSIHVLVTDNSEGMLAEAKQSLGNHSSFSFKTMDIQGHDLESNFFDVAIANHMLYHVPNISQALLGIQRILKPSGIFYASTNGTDHLKEIYKYVRDFDADIPYIKPLNSQYFGLETGLSQLEDYFDEVNLVRFDSHLEIPHAHELADFIFSISPSTKDVLVQNGLSEAFIQHLESKKDSRGVITVTKDTGLFICKGPKLRMN